jgi:hypothetical protein
MKLILLVIMLKGFIFANMMENIKSGLNTGINYAKEKTESTPVKAELVYVNMDLENIYEEIGKQYIEYIKIKENEKIDIGVNELLEKSKLLFIKKEKLEKKILEIEKKYESNI